MEPLERLFSDVCEMLAQPLNNSKQRDALIDSLRSKCLLFKSPQRQMYGRHSVSTQTEYTHTHLHKGFSVRKSEEDTTGRWWVCDCGLDLCMSCQAEKVADQSACQWKVGCLKCKQIEHSPQLLSEPPSVISDVRADINSNITDDQRVARQQKYHNSQDLPTFSPSDQVTLVQVIEDPVVQYTGRCSWYIFQLHPALSASAIPGQTGSPLSAGLIALTFNANILAEAHQFMIWTTQDGQQFANGLHEMILASLKEGIQTYALNYVQEEVKLTLEDMALVMSHLGYKIRTKGSLRQFENAEVLNRCMRLSPGHTLLLVWRENYKVISVVCRDFKMRKELIFMDPQYHKRVPGTSEFDCGVVLAYVLQEPQFVSKVIQQLSYICGPLQGSVSYAVLNQSN